MRHAFLVSLTGLLLRVKSNLPLVCPSPQTPSEVVKVDQKLDSSLMFKNYLCQTLLVGHWHKSLTWNLELRVVRIAGSHLVVHLVFSLIAGRMEVMGYGIPDMFQSRTSSTSSSSAVQAATHPQFLGQWRRITSNRFVLNLLMDHYL